MNVHESYLHDMDNPNSLKWNSSKAVTMRMRNANNKSRGEKRVAFGDEDGDESRKVPQGNSLCHFESPLLIVCCHFRYNRHHRYRYGHCYCRVVVELLPSNEMPVVVII